MKPLTSFNDHSRFWTIFDTATLKPYYQDVHNLLALPRGAILRYDYREKWLSEDAVAAASDSDRCPLKILLVYAEWNRYVKKEKPPPDTTPSSEIVFIPTRFAEMSLIARDGDNYFFDFVLGEYPRWDQQSFNRIISGRTGKGETPFSKWISISDDSRSLEQLVGGVESYKWQAIIDALTAPGMQFSGDYFFRVENVHKRGGFSITPKVNQIEHEISGEVEIRQKKSIYELYENDNININLTSFAPHSVASGNSGTADVNFVEVSLNENSGLVVTGPSKLDLRHYTGTAIQLKVSRFEELDEKETSILVRHSGDRDWPIGPALTFEFRIKKGRAKTTAAMIIALFAIVLLFVADKIWDKNPTLSIVLLIVGSLAALIFWLIYSGKVSFSF